MTRRRRGCDVLIVLILLLLLKGRTREGGVSLENAMIRSRAEFLKPPMRMSVSPPFTFVVLRWNLMRFNCSSLPMGRKAGWDPTHMVYRAHGAVLTDRFCSEHHYGISRDNWFCLIAFFVR